jgi:hypothetical protein
MYQRAILCTFQLLISTIYSSTPLTSTVEKSRLFWAQMALATLEAISGTKKSIDFRAPPPKMALLWICPPQNHYVPHHINRYINSYNAF